MITIREAKTSDAHTLSVFAERCFRDALPAKSSADDIEIYCSKAFGEKKQEDEISSDGIITLLVETGSELMAYSQLYFDKAPDCISSDKAGEVRRFYVDRKWHGKGVAQRLMSNCFTFMEKRNMEVAWLSTWEENLKAISFYKKMNFQKVGEQFFTMGNDQQHDVIMSLQLKGSE